MENILRIHEKVLDHLIHLRKEDNDLFFVPRKINRYGRLERGYWFLGDETDYLHLSFWNGEDWKHKIHNIGLVILHNRKSYIELSANDSEEKALFLKKLVNKLGGFRQLGKLPKWIKDYSGTDYLKNLDDFIRIVKPQIDDLIRKEKPKGILFLDEKFFNKYAKPIIDQRFAQIANGELNKLSKICWNSKNWKFPSGSEGKSLDPNSYEYLYGYGHEEWLFDNSRIVDGYHYAFLESLRLKTDKHVGKVYNIGLFTVNNLNKKYFIGEIKNVECIPNEESIRVYTIYKENGWVDEMKNELKNVGADFNAFLETEPEIFLNVRFKLSDVSKLDEITEISNFDNNITTNRYKLLPLKSSITSEILDSSEAEDDEGEGNKKSTGKRKKVFNGECEYDPVHDKIQNAVFEILKNSGEYKPVRIEKGRVDIKGKALNGDWHFFEVKTDGVKLSIRKALGQLMEYAYYPDLNKAKKLIIVAEDEPDADDIKYLDYIRTSFSIPVFYRHYSFEKNELSENY